MLGELDVLMCTEYIYKMTVFTGGTCGYSLLAFQERQLKHDWKVAPLLCCCC